MIYNYFYLVLFLFLLLSVIYIIYLDSCYNVDSFITKKTKFKKKIFEKSKQTNQEDVEDENYIQETIEQETIYLESHEETDDDDYEPEDIYDYPNNCCVKLPCSLSYPNRADSTDLDDYSRVDYDTTKPDYNTIFNYNQKKYYCNNFNKHKLLYPKTPNKMKIKTDNGLLSYRFKPNDICCVKGNPKNNFKKNHVKCCNFTNIYYDYPKSCYNSNLQ